MILIRKQFFLLLTVFIVGFSHLSYSEDKSCLSVFSARKEISDKVLSSDMSVYRGQEGHIKFVEELRKTHSMAYVFSIVYETLGKKEMWQLNWRIFNGPVSKYKNLRAKMLELDGSIKEEYKGMSAYVRIAKKYFSNDMLKAYWSISAVVGRHQMQELEWQIFYGTVSEFKELRAEVLERDGSIKEECKRREGYVRIAEEYYPDDMMEAYKKVSISVGLSKNQMRKELGWRSFQGSVSEYRELRAKLLDGDSIKEKYREMEGYVRIAQDHFSNDMKKAYLDVPALLDKKEMWKLGWRFFHGTVSEFKELKTQILERDGSIKKEYKGREGHAKFAEKYYSNDMKRTYNKVFAVLDKEQMRELGWRRFYGTVSKYNRFRATIPKGRRFY